MVSFCSNEIKDFVESISILHQEKKITIYLNDTFDKNVILNRLKDFWYKVV
jgi:hypothetical protein